MDEMYLIGLNYLLVCLIRVKFTKTRKKAILDNPGINMAIGHSAGGSASLQLEKDDPNKGLTSITYSAREFSIADVKQVVGKQEYKPLRFGKVGDLATMLDMNIQPIWHAPDYNTDLITNAIKLYNEQSPETIKNTFDSMKPEF